MNIEFLHQKFEEYGRHAREWQRKCALLLPEIEKYQVWLKKGFSCIYEYAANLAGMSRFQVDDALRIVKKIYDKPALLKIAEEKGINAVRPVAAIATKETAVYWAKKAKSMSKHDLEVFVRDYRKNDDDPRLQKLVMELSSEIAAELQKLNNDDWNALMKKLIAAYKKSLEEDKPQKVETASRHIPKPIENYIVQRSNGFCEFPGCKKKYDHLHHIDRFASKREHDPDRIIALCTAHHNLAHQGLIDEENWRIRREPDYTSLNWYVDEKVQFHRRL